MGNAHVRMNEVREKEQNLQRVIYACQQDLKVCSLSKSPPDYAITQNKLGNAYRGMAEVRDWEQNLQKAIQAYREALKVYSLTKFPTDYATTQNNLGNIYRGIAEVKDGEQNLQKAIQAYQEGRKSKTCKGLSTLVSRTSRSVVSPSLPRTTPPPRTSWATPTEAWLR